MDFIKKFQKWMLKHQRRKTKWVRRRRMHEPSSQDSLRMQIWTSSLRKLRLMKRTSKVRTMQQYFPKKVLVHYIVFGSERIFWSERMKNALGVGFPDEKNKINAAIFLKEGPGSLHRVRIGENILEWANEKRTRRGLSLSTFPESTNDLVIPCCRFHGGGSRPQEIVKRSD